MPKESSDRFQTRASPDHFGGQRMPEHMCPEGPSLTPARSRASATMRAISAEEGKGLNGASAQEDAVFLNRWTNLSDVGRSASPASWGSGSCAALRVLPSTRKRALVQSMSASSSWHTSPGAKAEASQEKDDCSIPDACRGGVGTGRTDTLHGFRADEARQHGVAPAWRKGTAWTSSGRHAPVAASPLRSSATPRSPLHRAAGAVCGLVQPILGIATASYLLGFWSSNGSQLAVSARGDTCSFRSAASTGQARSGKRPVAELRQRRRSGRQSVVAQELKECSAAPPPPKHARGGQPAAFATEQRPRQLARRANRWTSKFAPQSAFQPAKCGANEQSALRRSSGCFGVSAGLAVW